MTVDSLVCRVLGALAFVAVLFSVPSGVRAQDSLVDFEVPITVTDGENSTTLTIGMREGASSGRDEYDRPAPPPPPVGAFDARILGVDNHYFTDIRPLVDDPTDFEFSYQPADGKQPIVLTWDASALADLGSFVITGTSGSSSVSIDMATTDRLDTAAYPELEDGLLVNATARPTEPIPVELSFFEAAVSDNRIRLRWGTQSETNNVGFGIEHRWKGGAFQHVGFVDGAGTTSEPQTYQYEVGAVGPGLHAFRLRQVDADGTVNYSTVVTVEERIRGTYWLRGPFPNPVRTQAHVELATETSQGVTVEVFDLLGRRLHQSQVDLTSRRPHRFTLDVNALELSPGTYFLRLRGETFVVAEPVSVIR